MLQIKKCAKNYDIDKILKIRLSLTLIYMLIQMINILEHHLILQKIRLIEKLLV